jgi:hypothetical protein
MNHGHYEPENITWIGVGASIAIFIWLGLYLLDETLKRYNWRTFIGGLVVVVGTAIIAGLLTLMLFELLAPAATHQAKACGISAMAGVFGSAGKDGFLLIREKLFDKARHYGGKE